MCMAVQHIRYTCTCTIVVTYQLLERGGKNQQTVAAVAAAGSGGAGGVLVPVVVVAGGGSVARSQSQSHRPSSLGDRRQTKELIRNYNDMCNVHVHTSHHITHTTDVVYYIIVT